MSIRLGVNPLLWSNDDLPALGDETPIETCLAEARHAGYEGVEMGRKFPRTFDQLGPLLEHEDLALASGWYSSNLLERDVDAEIEAMQGHLALMKALGVTAMVFCETARCVHLDRARPVLAPAEADRRRLAAAGAAYRRRRPLSGRSGRGTGLSPPYGHADPVDRRCRTADG